MPIEPPPSRYRFVSPTDDDGEDLVAVGADLDPATLLEAYRHGLFPMPVDRRHLGWFSPDPRGVLPVEGLVVSRSLRRSVRRYDVTVDAAFTDVMVACGDPGRPHGWITRAFVEAYTELHRLGWAHSIETWSPEGDLVGGLYGVSIGGFFAGESMFHRATDASKVALVHLVGILARARRPLLDVQWVTPHLRSLGAVELPRSRYLALLGAALEEPTPIGFAPGRSGSQSDSATGGRGSARCTETT